MDILPILALIEMNYEDVLEFLNYQAQEYAKDISIAQDITVEEALKVVQSQREHLLFESKNELFFYIYLPEKNSKIGYIWLTLVNNKLLFISYVELFPNFRGKGFGSKAMELIESKAKELGFHQVWLHVFASNLQARKLYSKCGYKEYGVQMFKTINP